MDHELIENCKRLDDAARNHADAPGSFYSDDFLIHRLESSGETLVLDKQAVTSFVARQRNEDMSSRDTDIVEYLHASISDDIGMVVGKRTIGSNEPPVALIFSQIWRRKKNGWRMIRESVYARPV